MMNLVQLQERLRDVPMQALMQYANGANPQIPPFLALGELNRRKKMQESAAAEQAQEMEGAPTVKQQIEQAAGLLALQGSRQRQAAQQQQSAQQQAPMPAPNTTTSEPAQLAGGGFIDDIVVPRDFQAGGMAPGLDNLRKMMLLKKMQQRRRPQINPMQRSDYAGGGIVAFQEGGMPDTSETMRKKSEQYRKMLEALFGKPDQVDPADPTSLFREAKAETMSRPDENYSNEGRNYQGGAGREFKRSTPAPTEEGLPSIFQPRQSGGAPQRGSALSRFLGMKPEDMFKAEEPRSFDDILKEQKRRQGVAGISEDYLTEREKRLADLQAKREEARAGQPMEQLTAFLSGIAEGPRGGTFGTQGSRGAKASQALRAQQEALRDKQDMEMEELKFTVASKRDAIRRGDMKEAEALEMKEKELKRDMVKNQIEMAKGQASAETQGRQVEAYAQQASRPTDFERQKELYLQHARETGERPTAAGFQKFMLGSRASTVMTMEDAIRIAAQTLGPGATMEEIQQRARELLRLGTGGGGAVTVPSGVKVTREK